MAVYNTYTEEQQEFLKNNALLMSRKQLTELFNAYFKTDKSVRAIKSYCNSRGWYSSDDGKFKKGNVSWQTGLTKQEFRSHYTEETYNKMIRAAVETHKTKKIGDEIVIEGVPWIVISLDYSKPYWKRRIPKRRFVWESVNGPIPKGFRIINLDQNQMNCRIENLYCVPARFITVMSRNKWWSTNPQITLAAIKWCELFYVLKEIKENES